VVGLHATPLALAFPSSSFVRRALVFYVLGRVILHGFLWLEGRVAEKTKRVNETRTWAKATWKANAKWLARASMFTSMLIVTGLTFGM